MNDIELEKLSVVVCSNVFKNGALISHVTLDDDHEFQFLCDNNHEDGDEEPINVHLGCLLEKDPTILEPINKLCCLESAERISTDSPWNFYSEMQQKIAKNIKEYGVHVMTISPGENEDEPPLQYSIGLMEKYNHPEIITTGLPSDNGYAIINYCKDRIKSGEIIATDVLDDNVLKKHSCIFKNVTKKQVGYNFGYAVEYYGHSNFPAIQLIWPDVEGKFPWEDCYNSDFQDVFYK